MPPFRPRYALSALERKLKFARVVAIQGVRQSGKSFLVQNFLKNTHPDLVLERFDFAPTRTFASENPDLFLQERASANPLVLDEAQKVPAIFDAVKVRVDENPTPGRYVLLGSTEFSHLFKIQESLTGRMSRLRLFPMTLGECFNLPNRKGDLHEIFFKNPRATTEQVLTMLERGGMPGIFAGRSHDEREGLFEDWINLTCNRDIHQIPRMNLDSDLTREILRMIATLEYPIASEIAKGLRVSVKILNKHLKALEALFVIHRLAPHLAGTGKDRYYLCDVGIAYFLGANRQCLLETWLIQEFSTKRALLPAPSKRRLSYYRTSKGSTIPLIIEDEKLEITLALNARYKDKLDRRDLEILRSFEKACAKNHSNTTMFKSYLLLANSSFHELEGTIILPWGSVV